MYRAGRITASYFKTAVHTISNPSQSFIKQICYPQNYKFKTQATQWGIDHERLAIASFSEQIISNGANLHIHMHYCGLIVNPLYPHLGASPDGIIECSRVVKGVLEVKCPYQCKELSFQEASKELSFQKQGKTLVSVWSHMVHHSHFVQTIVTIIKCNSK